MMREESEADKVDEESDVYEILDEVVTDEGLSSASESVDTLDLDEVLLLEEPIEEPDDALSRRPPPDDEVPEEVRAIRKETKKNTDSFVLVGENLPLLQRQDPELERLVKFRLNSTVAPTNEELQVESELTKSEKNEGLVFADITK